MIYEELGEDTSGYEVYHLGIDQGLEDNDEGSHAGRFQRME